ncbi:MAG TPA: group 1 truncated hemoglobin [Bacteroidia bacterium]|jgi:hypothetical protein|nr:group 1 truncated hemoglobin [Bacteroidia bacterium]
MKKLLFMPLIVALGIVCSLLSLNSCSKKSDAMPAATIGKALYDTLGGTTLTVDPTHQGAMIEKGRLAIRNVIDSTIFVIAADPKINSHFTILLSEVGKGDLSGYTDLSENLTTFVANATGAKDFIYIGLNMKDAHNPATNPRMNGKSTNADFTEFETDLVAGANKNKVPQSLINSLGKIVESLRSVVVQ